MFLAIVPGVVAGLVPWWLARGQPDYAVPVRIVGGVLAAVGAAVLIGAFAQFVIGGLGTPAPLAPTEQLVVSGHYRYVRNPMYVAVLAIIGGRP